jgi:hypothetical protein
MPGVTVRRNARGPLAFTTLIRLGEVLFWDRMRVPKVTPRGDDKTHTVKSTDRLDLLAMRNLGSSHLGHVILERNAVRLWPNDLVPGMTIAIPTKKSLEERGFI